MNTNLPILQSPYQLRLQEQKIKDYENRSFFRINETSFERIMLKNGQPASIDVFYTKTKRGKGEITEIATIKANEISGRWSTDPEKEYKTANPGKDFFVQSNSRQQYLDLCTLGYVEYLRSEFIQWILTNSWPKFGYIEEAREHHQWLFTVCELKVIDAIMINTYETYINTGINHFANPGMEVRMGNLVTERGITEKIIIAEQRVLKNQGLGADARKFQEDSIINNPNLTPEEKERRLQAVVEKRFANVEKVWPKVVPQRNSAVHQISKDLQETENRYRLEHQLRLLEGEE